MTLSDVDTALATLLSNRAALWEARFNASQDAPRATALKAVQLNLDRQDDLLQLRAVLLQIAAVPPGP